MNDNTNFWQSARIQTAAFGLLIVLAAFFAIKMIGEIKEIGYIGKSDTQNLITVSGKGEVFAKPDIATFSFTVEEQAKTVPEAQKLMDAKLKEAFDFLKNSDIAEKDYKTVSYQVFPSYEYYVQPAVCTSAGCPPYREPKIIGYKVSQTIEVKVREIESAGDVLAGIGNLNVMNVSGLNFSVDQEEKLQADARRQAIDDARAKAEALADQLGVNIVSVANFSEGGSYPPIYYAKTMAADGRGGTTEQAPSVAVAPGQTNIISNVTITYEIK
jgi:hypothetical protein